MWEESASGVANAWRYVFNIYANGFQTGLLLHLEDFLVIMVIFFVFKASVLESKTYWQSEGSRLGRDLQVVGKFALTARDRNS
jgi:hypothetical protein